MDYVGRNERKSAKFATLSRERCIYPSGARLSLKSAKIERFVIDEKNPQGKY